MEFPGIDLQSESRDNIQFEVLESDMSAMNFRFSTINGDDPIRYYPIGNDRSADITKGLHIEDETSLLFLGCGDIRNVLHTIHGLCERDLRGPHQVHIYLNDIEEGVLARDLLLLHLVKTLDPQKEGDMLFLWAVWYDVILSQDHYNRLKQSLQKLMSECEAHEIRFGNEQTRAGVKSALTSWFNNGLSAQEIIEKRKTFFHGYYTVGYPSQPIDRVAGKIVNNHVLFTKYSRLNDSYVDEVRDYITLGLTRVSRRGVDLTEFPGGCGANVTLMRPGSDVWAVEDNSSPYMCYDPGLDIEKYDGSSVSMSSLFVKTLKMWVMSYQTAAEHRLSVQISLWLGEATAVVESDLPTDLRFDFIDTSNIADRVGLLPLLVHCRGRLRKASGVLFTESFRWDNVADDVDSLLRQCIDLSPLMYPTVLGLHLAEELDLGHESGVPQGTFVGNRKLTLRWRAAREQEHLVRSADAKSDAVSSALELLERMKGKPDPENVLTCGPEALSKLQRRLRDSITHSGGDEQRKYVVEEMEDRYKVTLNVRPDQLTGSMSVKEDEKNPGTVLVVNNMAGSSALRGVIHLSCGVTHKESRLTKSRNTGIVEGTFYKDHDSTVGERVLPWKLISTRDVTHLRNYPQTDLAMANVHSEVASMYPVPEIQMSQNLPVEMVLMKLNLYFLKTLPTSLGVNVLICTATPSIKKDRNRYLFEGLKIFEDKPASFLTWYDLELGERLARKGKVNWQEVAAIANAPFHYIDDTVSSSRVEGMKRLKSILLLNSCRLTQDLPLELRWKTRSFVRARYPHKDFDTLLTEFQLRHGLPDGGAGDVAGAFDRFCELLQQTGGPGSARQHAQNAVEANKCAVCDKSDDVRRCSRCLRVAYCSKKCQRKDWRAHKKQCQKQ